jgi:hypothetical protein
MSGVKLVPVFDASKPQVAPLVPPETTHAPLPPGPPGPAATDAAAVPALLWRVWTQCNYWEAVPSNDLTCPFVARSEIDALHLKMREMASEKAKLKRANTDMKNRIATAERSCAKLKAEVAALESKLHHLQVDYDVVSAVATGRLPIHATDDAGNSSENTGVAPVASSPPMLAPSAEAAAAHAHATIAQAVAAAAVCN